MSKLRAAAKFSVFGLYCGIFATISAAILSLPLSAELRRRRLNLWMSFMSQKTLRLLGVNVSYEQTEHLSLRPNYLIVSNHLSYLDILILAARFPCCFVTSFEVKEMPFLGALTELGGCLYVERRSKKNIFGEIQQIQEALEQEVNVCIFPEATSTNGESVLRFRRPLFAAANKSNTPVLPVCINYRAVDGEQFDVSNRDMICWYGDMDFLPHFWNLLSKKEIDVDVTACEALLPHSDDPEVLAMASHQAVSRLFIAITSGSTTREESPFPKISGGFPLQPMTDNPR